MAALFWFLFCVGWFDAAEPMRPAWLGAVPAWPFAVLCFAAAFLWLRPRFSADAGLLLVLALAFAFRLPLAWWGAWGYTTADGSLSGIMALHARDGVAHHVFVPSVAYSGSLKSHLAALLSGATGLSLVRAFALSSVFFYVLFAAAVYQLGRLAGGPRSALLAGLYAAFAPTFVTWYSLSNDGNYVEVLALGTAALWLTCRLLEAPADAAPRLALATGLLLGLGFWCHILVMSFVAAVALAVVLGLRRRAPPALALLALGFALGDLPGLLWNLGHGFDSFAYLVPSSYWDAARPAEAEARAGIVSRVWLALVDHGPILFGYDAGYAPVFDALSRAFAWLGVFVFIAALAAALRRALAAGRLQVDGVLLIFTLCSLGAALVALPHIAGNPRYLLFLFAPATVLIARLLEEGRRRALLFALIAFGCLGALGQARAKLAESFEWRRFVADLRREGVRHCYTDYYLAARIDFFAEESPLCSSKLGPTTTEYFLEYRERVDRAPTVDIVAVNAHSADRIEGKLKELNVRYERRDFMKPVLLRLSRKVDPRELFPGRDFRPR